MSRNFFYAAIALAFVAGVAIAMSVRTPPAVVDCSKQSC
jgi:hypothetical protein